MKQACAESNCNIWPNYNIILEAKSLCRPNGILLEELSAEVPLQNLLNHTASRLLHNVSLNYFISKNLALTYCVVIECCRLS